MHWRCALQALGWCSLIHPLIFPLCIAGAEQLGSQAAASAAQIHAIALYDEGGQALQQGTLLLCVVLLGHR
jgi:hypothetical protein